MKMYQFFTARYSDGRTVYEKTLEWIYSHQNGSGVEISPTIWLWKATGGTVYFVDYVGDGVSCTIDTFDTLDTAQEYQERIGQMEEKEFEGWLIDVRWGSP